MACLTVRLLGGFEASLTASAPVEFPTRKAQALLAYLACHAGQRQPRERLANLLWEDFDDEHAHANLRQTLKLLRRSIRNSQCRCVITEGQFVYLDADRIETDVAEFERYRRRERISDLQHAADLYAGEFLDGVQVGVASFDDWVRAERVRYHDRAVEALRKLLKYNGGPADLDWRIRTARRLLALDPLQEDVHRTLMKLYAERGDRHLAVKQYLACCDLLRSELGLEPGVTMERLYREIRTGEFRAGNSEPPPASTEPVRAGGERVASRRLGIASVGEDLPLPGVPSIAVLPFRNLTGDPDRDDFCEGFRLDIQAALIKVSRLLLIAPGTVNRYRNRDVSSAEVGRGLGVLFTLTGGIRRQGQALLAAMQLTNTVSQQVVWSENVECLPDSALTLQRILSGLLEAAHIELHAGEEARIFQGTLRNPEARACFYRGVNLGYAMTREGIVAAREMFERVVELEPSSPVGPTYTAFSHWMEVVTGWADDRQQSLEQAVIWAKRALEYPGTNGLAHIVLEDDHLLGRRFDAALEAGRVAVGLRPNCPVAHAALAKTLLFCGRADEALSSIRRAIRMSPAYPAWFLDVLAASYRDSGDLESAISVARRAIEVNANDVEARHALCTALIRDKAPELAVAIAREIREINPRFSLAMYAKGQPYRDKKVLRRLVEELRAAGVTE